MIPFNTFFPKLYNNWQRLIAHCPIPLKDTYSQDDTIATSTPISCSAGDQTNRSSGDAEKGVQQTTANVTVPGIEIEACTPEPISPSRQKLRLDMTGTDGNR